jgi:glycosyltransferase involved in cell wall biosynthesis
MKKNINISMIIVALNSENYIVNAIQSLIKQGFPKDLFEIILVDGNSSDRTVELGRGVLKKNDINYQILNNEKKILSIGWNIGLKAAIGEYVIRIDAHSELMPGYVESGLNKLKSNTRLAGIGGIIETVSNSYIGKRIAIVLSSKIAVGNSLFRVGVKMDTISDTAVYAVYRKNACQSVGLLDEKLQRNQDLDFHKKLRANGYLLMTSPDMKAVYFSRSSVQKFIKQAFNNGFWVINSKGFYLRHLAPLFFMLTSIFLIFLSNEYFLIYITIYFMTIFLFFLKLKIFDTFFETILTFLLHTFYGLGSLYGIFKRSLGRLL